MSTVSSLSMGLVNASRPLELEDDNDNMSLAALTSRSTSILQSCRSTASTGLPDQSGASSTQRPLSGIQVTFSAPSKAEGTDMVITLPPRPKAATPAPVDEDRPRKRRTLQQIRDFFIEMLKEGGDDTWTVSRTQPVPTMPCTESPTAFKRKARSSRHRESESAAAPPFEAPTADPIEKAPSTPAKRSSSKSRSSGRSTPTTPTSSRRRGSSATTHSEAKSRPRPSAMMEDLGATPPTKAHPAVSYGSGPTPPSSAKGGRSLAAGGVRYSVGKDSFEGLSFKGGDSWTYEKLEGFSFNPSGSTSKSRTKAGGLVLPSSGSKAGPEKSLAKVHSLPSISSGMSPSAAFAAPAAQALLQIGGGRQRFF